MEAFGIALYLAGGLLAALACALIFSRRRMVSWWPLVAVVCWIVGAGSIFYQCEIAETLYGIDGRGGPYESPQ